MSKYGILHIATDLKSKNLLGSYTIYQTDLDYELLNSIEKFGYDKMFNEIYEQNYKEGIRSYLFNRESNVVITSYPPGAGGNFLTNCMSISEDIKLEKYPTQKEKCNFVCSSYDRELLYWHDTLLPMVDDQLHEESIILGIHVHNRPFSPGNVKQWFIFWKKCDKIILFKNSNLFNSLRDCYKPTIDLKFGESDENNSLLENKSSKLSKILKNKNIDLCNYKDLLPEVKNKLQNICNDKKNTLKQNYSYCKLENKKQFYFWDVNWFLDKEEFLFNIRKMYDGIGLSGFNEELVSNCYDSWMNAMCRSLKIRKQYDQKLNK